jgi:hypothetical protein
MAAAHLHAAVILFRSDVSCLLQLHPCKLRRTLHETLKSSVKRTFILQGVACGHQAV